MSEKNGQQSMPFGNERRPTKKIKIDDQEEFGPNAVTLAEVQNLRIALEEAKLGRERDRQRHAVKLEEITAQSEKLEKRVRFLTTEERNAQNKLREAKEAEAEAWETREREMVGARVQIQDLMEERDDALEKARTYQRRLMANETLATEDFTAELEELHTQLRVQERKLKDSAVREAELNKDLMAAKHELEEERRNARSKALGLAGDAAEAAELKNLRKKVIGLEQQLKDSVEEKERLQSQAKNTTLLEISCSSTEEKLKRAQTSLAEDADLRAQYQRVLREREDWAARFSPLLAGLDSPPDGDKISPTPEAAMDVLHRYQVEKEALCKKLGMTEAQMVKLNSDFEEVRQERLTLSGLLHKEEEKVLKLEDTCQTLELTNSRLLKDVASQKEQLKILEENPMIGKEESAVIKQRDDRIIKLEQSLNAAQEEIVSLQSQSKLMTPASVISKSRERAAKLEVKLEKAETKNTQLLRHLEKVERDLAKYEHEAAKGNYNKATTKILHLAMNPTAKAAAKRSENKMVQELALLREENEQLKGQLKQKSNTSDSGMDNSELNSSRVEGIDSNKLNQRLKETFKQKITQFREAVYRLFGYKVEMAVDREMPKLRLRSMYAEQEGDELLFQWGSHGLELCETAFASKLDQKTFAYLTQCHSVPAFLSTITLDLFEQQTYQAH